MSSMRVTARIAIAVLFVLAAGALLPRPVSAHLYLVRSEPADGARLGVVPAQLRLTFSEPVQLTFSRVELLDPDGNAIPLPDPAVQPGEPNVLLVFVEGPLRAGPYLVVWRTTSADGHVVRGRIAFEIDEDAEGLAAVADTVDADTAVAAAPVHHDPVLFPESDGFGAESPGYVLVRWLTFIGLLGVIGIVAFRVVVLGLVGRRQVPEGLALLEPAASRSADAGLAFAALLGIAVLARLYAQALALYGPGEATSWNALSSMLTGTVWGRGWLLQLAATLVVLIGFGAARRRRRGAHREADREQEAGGRSTASRADDRTARQATYGSVASPQAATVVLESEAEPFAIGGGSPERIRANGENGTTTRLGWVLASAGAVMLAFTPALSGHAVAVPEYAALAVLSDGLHVLGAGGWLGSLLAVVVIGIPSAMRLGEERRGRATAVLVNAFSPAALAFAAVVTATGVLSAAFHLGSLSDLWQSSYGRTLLVKVGVLSLVFGAGAYNWRRVRPALGDDAGTHRLRRSAGFELAVGAAVLLITAVLVATPPPLNGDDVANRAAAEIAP
jgi:copper transport protein